MVSDRDWVREIGGACGVLGRRSVSLVTHSLEFQVGAGAWFDEAVSEDDGRLTGFMARRRPAHQLN